MLRRYLPFDESFHRDQNRCSDLTKNIHTVDLFLLWQKMFWLFIRDSMWAAWFGGIVCAYDSMVHQVTHTTKFYFDTDINIQQSIHSPSGWSLRHLLKILLIQSLLNHCISSLFSFKSPEIQAKLCDGIFEE